MKYVCASALLVGFLGGCSADPPAGPAGSNGVNDVAKACAIRAGWANGTSSVCVDCKSFATTPYCECLDVPENGACYAQQRGKTDEPTCENIDLCTGACAIGDCACVDACYVAKDACRKAAAAVDGCLVETCEKDCR